MAQAREAAPSKSEWWGYVVWGSAAVVVLIPELTAAISHQVWWPTISSTVGHLEYLRDWVGLIVVGLIVAATYELIRYPLLKGQEPRNPVPRTSMGRIRRRGDEQTELSALLLIVGSVCIATGAGIAAGLDPPKAGDFFLGYVLYGLIAMFTFIIPSIVAFWWRRDVAFPTLFATVANLEHRRWCHFIAVLVVAGLVILVFHLGLYPWPNIYHQLKPPSPTSL
jgi:hypothetical protein